MLKGCTFDNQNVSSTNDGGLYQSIIGADGILWGCSMSTTASTLTIQPGQMLIGGRIVWVNGATQFSFTDPIVSGYGQVILTIDLTQTATTSEFAQVQLSVVYSATTTFPALTQGDINVPGGDTTYQKELAVVSIANSNITGITRQIASLEPLSNKLSNTGGTLYLPDGTPVGNLTTLTSDGTDIVQLQGNTLLSLVARNGEMVVRGGTNTVIQANDGTVALQSAEDAVVQNLSGAFQGIRASEFYMENNMGISTAAGTVFILTGSSSRAQFRCDGGCDFLNNAAAELRSISASNVQGSSQRYKDDIVDLTEGEAEQILQLRPVSFAWKPETGYTGNSMSVIAEEAAKVDERYIYRDNEGNVEGILPNPLIAGLIKLCQMQEKKINDLENRIQTLEGREEDGNN